MLNKLQLSFVVFLLIWKQLSNAVLLYRLSYHEVPPPKTFPSPTHFPPFPPIFFFSYPDQINSLPIYFPPPIFLSCEDKIFSFISTEVALRIPMTYDCHPIPSHPTYKASLIILAGIGLTWVDLQWSPMTSNDLQRLPMTSNDWLTDFSQSIGSSFAVGCQF